MIVISQVRGREAEMSPIETVRPPIDIPNIQSESKSQPIRPQLYAYDADGYGQADETSDYVFAGTGIDNDTQINWQSEERQPIIKPFIESIKNIAEKLFIDPILSAIVSSIPSPSPSPIRQPFCGVEIDSSGCVLRVCEPDMTPQQLLDRQRNYALSYGDQLRCEPTETNVAQCMRVGDRFSERRLQLMESNLARTWDLMNVFPKPKQSVQTRVIVEKYNTEVQVRENGGLWQSFADWWTTQK
jgi:hypothetical protein